MTRSLRLIAAILTVTHLTLGGAFAPPAHSDTGLSSTKRATSSISNQASQIDRGTAIATDSRPVSVSDAHTRLTEAELNFEASRKALRKARQRRYPRGQALEDLRQRARHAAAALDQAEDDFLLQIHDAQRQGEPAEEWVAFLDQAEELENTRRSRTQSD